LTAGAIASGPAARSRRRFYALCRHPPQLRQA